MAELRVKGTGTIKLFENDNTSNVTIASPASLGADRTVTLPDANVTLASGTMNDATNLSGTVPIANGGTGATTLAGAGLDVESAFMAYLSAAQTGIADGVETKVQFNTVLYQSGSDYDNSTNYRWTPTTSGKYIIYAQISYYSGFVSNVYFLQATIQRNGANIGYKDMDYRNNQTGYGGTLSMMTTASMNGSSDYCEAFGYMTGANVTAQQFNGGINTSYFGAYKLIGI